MKYNSNKLVLKYTFFISIINLIYIIFYSTGSSLLKKQDLLFRGWLNDLYFLNILALIIMIIVIINESKVEAIYQLISHPLFLFISKKCCFCRINCYNTSIYKIRTREISARY